MKKSLIILVMAAVLFGTQACGPSSEKKAAEEAAAIRVADSTKQAEADAKIVVAKAERRAELEREIVQWEEKRRVALDELVKLSPTYKDPSGILVFNKAEVEPSFEGGRNAMRDYLNNNLIYPKNAQDNGLEGTVFVDFIVGADGMVRNAVVSNETSSNVDQSFRDESIRVVNAMPKWIAGRQHGKAVNVKYSLPITFQMN
jgi:TonB family protein